MASSSKVWRAPLPEPSDYAEYGRIEPSAPERILAQWEEESRHRRAYEMAGLNGFNRRGEIGLRNALIFALSALSVATVALVLHEPWVAGVIGGGTIATGIGAFVYQQRGGRTGLPPDTNGKPPVKREGQAAD